MAPAHVAHIALVFLGSVLASDFLAGSLRFLNISFQMIAVGGGR